MAKRYFGEFYSVTGKLHRVEIHDAPNGSQSGATELTLSGVGYEIQREGEGDPFYENFLRPSRSSSFWVMPQGEILADFEGIAQQSEQYWAVLIYQDNALVHVGRVLADQMQFKRDSIESKIVVELTAVDGLQLLDGYNVQETWFTDGKITVAQMFRESLQTLGLFGYWDINGTANNYFRDAVSPYSSDAARKGIDLLQVDINTFVDDYDPFRDIKSTDLTAFEYGANNMLNCKQALEQLCEILQARLVHENGVYWLVSAAQYLGAQINYRQYNYTLQYITAGTLTHAVQLGDRVRPQWGAKPIMTYQPAAKVVNVETERTLNTGVYRTYAESEALRTTQLSKQFTGIPTGSTPDAAPIRIRFALKFARWVFSPQGPEDETHVGIKIWLTNSVGDIKILDNNNFYWIDSAYPPTYWEKIKTDTQSTTWTSFVFDKQVTTAPAGFDKLNVEVYQVLAIKNKFNIFGNPTTGVAPYQKAYWGSIQVAFADQSPYQNPDFTFNVIESYTPDTTFLINDLPNSKQIYLKPKYYYSSNQYAVGNIRAYNSSDEWVLADDWYGGWDSTTHDTPTKILGLSTMALYTKFVPTVQGVWIDSGVLTAVKSLYFDEFKWVLNGCVYTARNEQWDGEWIGIIPVYTGMNSSGEGLKIGSGLKDRVNYQDEQIGRLNDSVQRPQAVVLSYLLNDGIGAPSTAPTIKTEYEVMLSYNVTDEQFAWEIREKNDSVTYTAGTHSLTGESDIILCNSVGGTINIDLPNPLFSKGQTYYLKKINAAHTVVIEGGGGDIDGEATYVMSANMESVTVKCDGSDWWTF